MEKTDILSLSLSELETTLTELGEPKYRSAQIFDWLHNKKAQTFSEMTSISAKLREQLDDTFCIKSLISLQRLESVTDNTVKYLYGLSDGNCVETVLMEYDYGLSLCISTQVGCRMGCRFCASAAAGFVRNLAPSEILLQYYTASRECAASGKKISHIVLMGIGEPLDNYDNVTKFLQLLSSPKGDGMSLRHVALSTCGLVPRIYDLAALKLGLTLSVSLHAANDSRRSEIMPINKKYQINELLRACEYYFKQTGRRVTFEYAVIAGENSSQKDAEELAKLLHGNGCHINLIPVNSVDGTGYHATRREAEAFRDALAALGINATVRRTLGSDINAACGQLRRSYEASTKD